jgi:serine/threonine protein kinase
MRLRRQSNGQYINLEPTSTLGVGGEARIYALLRESSLVAKVYHDPTDGRARKLAAMLANPPDDPMAAQGHVSIAWPVDLLCSVDGEIVGFLMPLVTGMRSILDFYNPGARRQHCPLFNYLYLHRTARNLAAAVCALHERGYVIGDVNESNILVADTALVTLVDTDSFQVCDPYNGAVYRCTVGKPEFTPPELQGKTFADIDRAPEDDLFGLAVLIFQLLMEGTHPFAGMFQGEGDPPSYQERISAGHFPYSRGRRVPYRPALTAPPFEILHPALRKLFVRCFKGGRKKPRARPDAQVWKNALNDAEDALITCSVNDQHLYGGHLKTCPWCERSAQLGGRDPFPSWQSVQSGEHLQPKRKLQLTQTPLPSRMRGQPRKTGSTGAIYTAPTQPAMVKHTPVYAGAWRWTSLVLASLAACMLVGGILPRGVWLVCVAATVVWGVVPAYVGIWRWVKMLIVHSRWVAGAALGMGTATILALLLVAVLIGEILPWWLLLVFEATLGLGALVCGVISWRRVKTALASAGRDRWVAGAALGMGTAAAVSVLLLVASFITEEKLPWRLSLIFVVVLGAAALICGVVGWRWVKMLAGRGRWVAGVALGMGTAIILMSLLALLEIFMLVGDRLYLTTLACAVVLGPAALVCGMAGWEWVRDLAGQRNLWLVCASSGLLAVFMLVCGQLYVAALIYAVLALGTAALVCVFDWQRVKVLAGQGRWLTGAALGMGTIVVMLVLLLVALSIAEESLPWWLLLVFEALLGPAALACSVIGWRRVKVLAGRGRWAAGAALGMGTAAVFVLLLALLAALILAGGQLQLTALICALVLGPGALACGVVGWRRRKTLACSFSSSGRWIASALALAALGMGTTVTLVLLFSVTLLVKQRL